VNHVPKEIELSDGFNLGLQPMGFCSKIHHLLRYMLRRLYKSRK
jgi:hypothetical protein